MGITSLACPTSSGRALLRGLNFVGLRQLNPRAAGDAKTPPALACAKPHLPVLPLTAPCA
jgi:hypothetical protein